MEIRTLKKLLKLYKKAKEEAKEFKHIFYKTYPLLDSEERRNLNCVYSYYMWKRRERQAKKLLEAIKRKAIARGIREKF